MIPVMDLDLTPEYTFLAPALTVRTGEAVRIDTPDGSGSTVTLEEAVQGWKVSESTLRRRLKQGSVPGAVKLPSSKGERWRIPIASLEKCGWLPRVAAPVAAEPKPAPGSSEVELGLLAMLRHQQLQLEAASADRERERQQREQLLVEVALANQRVEDLTAEVQRLRETGGGKRRRGLFRRGK